MITASQVKELRTLTGAGMMECKKVLVESNGDIKIAEEILKKRGHQAAKKKEARVAAEGRVTIFMSEDNKTAAILELNCETDFVESNEEFINLSNNLTKLVAFSKAKDVEEFLSESYIQTGTVREALASLIARLGENIVIRRFERFCSDDLLYSYSHGQGRIGVILELKAPKDNLIAIELAKDISMHITASKPLYVSSSDLFEEVLREKGESFRLKAISEGKSEGIIEKLVEGKLKKFIKETCLMEQEWIRNPEYTISQLIKEKALEGNVPIKIVRFVRYEKGDGIEKKENNFLEEVQKQIDRVK